MKAEKTRGKWVVLCITLSTIIALLALAVPAWATVIHVPGDALSIQEAIDRALPGDVIIVAPGIYMESLLINNKNKLTIQAQNPSTVTIKANGDKPTIIINRSNEIKLQGFIISGGTQVDLATLQAVPAGGGIVITDSQKTVLDQLKLKDNIGLSLSISGSSVQITQMEIPAPTKQQPGQRIAGVKISKDSKVTIEGIMISDNPGDGIIIENSTLNLSKGQIQKNEGSGLQAKGATLTVADTTITKQQTNGAVLASSQAQMTNIQIVDNQGVGLTISVGSNVTINGATVSGHPQGAVLVTDSKLTLQSGTITGNAGSGIDAQKSEIHLKASKIFAQPGDGVRLANASAEIADTQITNNQGLGVNSTSSTLTMSSSEVSGHPGDAIALKAASKADIDNSQVHDNDGRGLNVDSATLNPAQAISPTARSPATAAAASMPRTPPPPSWVAPSRATAATASSWKTAPAASPPARSWIIKG